MIRAIIFDCFGVLVRDGWLPFCERHFGDDPARMKQARELSHAMNRGYLPVKEYSKELALLTGKEPAVVAREINQNPPNNELFDVMRGWKTTYKLGLLSNAGENNIEQLIGRDKAALFDAMVFSYEIGAAKPDAQMYEAIAAKLGVRPEECIFIDDQEHYCTGAQAVGMKTICYQDNIQLIEEFKNHNIFAQNA